MHATAPIPSKPPALGRSQGSAMNTANTSVAETARLSSLRRSTPDSEAVLSSDDEHELTRSIHSLTGRPPARTGEGGSWLNEIQSGPPRRPSTTTIASNMSQPTTPYDQMNDSNGNFFQNPLSRVVSNPVNITWGAPNPWGAPQSRMLVDDRQGFGGVRESRDGALGFSLPLQPVSKTHRSQSYSVGQMEAEMMPVGTLQNSPWDRQRSTPSQQVPHRPSRPSMLSGVLGGSGAMSSSSDRPDGGLHSMRTSASPDGRRDNLVESSNNPLLRHATKARARHGQGAAPDSRVSSALPASFLPMSSSAAVEQVIDEEPDPDQFSALSLTRRFSELTGLGGHSDAHRRSQWQSSLGFGLLPDIPQSRRHSMAEMPTRRNSLSASSPDPTSNLLPLPDDDGLLRLHEQYPSTAIQDDRAYHFAATPSSLADINPDQRDLQNRNYAVSYFSGIAPAIRSQMESSQSPVSAISPHTGSFHHQGPPHGLFSRPNQDTPLYLVSFKCARAEVYYVADNTGLEVKEGDLVIVEADRGHDLGTVLNVKLSWNQARELKIKANDEHYRWLMMFSRHNQSSGPTAGGGTGGMMAGTAIDRPSPASLSSSAMFSPTSDSMHRDAELKPKMIKRLAQTHEIATLRDKEGNEAKAKRICQQKVNEMKLDMEILDAEFQTDWKKLTFFYYANSYVNFNALVTDLFKVYKTRIWMSAVNPASLNTAPVPPPRGLGPGAVPARDANLSPRAGAGGQFHNYSEPYGSGMMYNPGQNPYDYQMQGESGTQTPQQYDMMQYQGYGMVPGYGWNMAGFAPQTGYAMNPTFVPQRGQERFGAGRGPSMGQGPISPPAGAGGKK